MEFGALTLVAAAVSLLVQWLKNYTGTGTNATLAIVVALSLVAGGLYTFVDASFWSSFYNVLVQAGAVYVFIIRRFEK